MILLLYSIYCRMSIDFIKKSGYLQHTKKVLTFTPDYCTILLILIRLVGI